MENKPFYIMTSYEEALMFIAMYGFPEFKKVFEFDGWDGETNFIHDVAKEFCCYINKVDWNEAENRNMTIYDFCLDFVEEKIEEMNSEDGFGRYAQYIYKKK